MFTRHPEILLDRRKEGIVPTEHPLEKVHRVTKGRVIRNLLFL